MRASLRLPVLAVLAALTLTSCGTAPTTSAPATHTITDMAGRRVDLPTEVDRVVTLGSVPVINSLLFALGEGEVIVNGLPDFAANPRWKYQGVFRPGIESQPKTQGADNAPAVEDIVRLDPDVVLTMDQAAVPTLEAVGLRPFVLKWTDSDDAKTAVDLLGDVLDQPARAADYRRYFDTSLRRVEQIVDAIPDSQRVRALHLNPAAMTRPHLISEWWIPRAGGVSVARERTETEIVKLDVEQVLAWNPQVLFVNSPAELATVYADTRLADLAAVRDHRVYSLPIAAHTWGNRTSEQPLTVLWAATKLYPQAFENFGLADAVDAFYRDIYHHDLTDAQVAEILAGM